MKENVRLGRIAGVAVGFSWSLLLFAGILALLLGSGRFPADAPGYTTTAYVVAGLFTAVAFLAGELAHEISHALVARKAGLQVDGIVLWLMGGYTRIAEPPASPAEEFRIAAAGPAVSLFLGLACVVVALGASAIGLSPLAVAVLKWLGVINVLLAVFNMLPGAPLDGGRVVHSAVWWRTGDKYRATRTASRAGTILGFLLVGIGLLGSAYVGLDGLWLALVGFFLMMASKAEGGAAVIMQALDGLSVGNVLVQPGFGPGWFTVDAFLRDYAGAGTAAFRPPAFLLEQWGGGYAGLAPTAAMEAVASAERYHYRASQFATPLMQLMVFSPEVPAIDALTQMSTRKADWALVVAGGQIVGVVSPDTMQSIAQQYRRPRPTAPTPSWNLTGS